MSKKKNLNKKKKIIIVGAGPGGLTAGMILSSRGFDVEIYEKQDRVGGRSRNITQDGFNFDMGPTFLMMKFLLDEMFELAGEDIDDYMKSTRLDPMYTLDFGDFQMDISGDREKMKSEINKHFPGEAEKLDKFFQREGERFEKLYPVLKKNYNSIFSFLSPIMLKALPHLPKEKSLYDYLGNYFDSHKLRLAFTFQAKYLGMSPFECPALFVILPYLEHKFGIFHVEGGLSKISESMAQVINKKGGKIHLNSSIKQLIVDEKRKVNGIILNDGTHKIADEVILNADFAYAMNNLIPKGVLKKYSPENIQKKKFSCSTFMIYLGIKGEFPEMKHHTIYFTNNYKQNLEDIFNNYKVTDDFSFYVRNASVTDKTVAPKGMTNLYILVPVPNNKSGHDWESDKKKMRDAVLSRFKERTSIHDLEDRIVTEHIITPNDWEDQNIHLGAVFNLNHSMDNLLLNRPHNKFEELDNLYLVGGGTHPGSGLPTIYESGRIASDLITKKYKK